MAKSKRQKLEEQTYATVNRGTVKLTADELKKELVLICGEVPDNMPFGPEGKCPHCIDVYYTGSPLCAKHLKIARKGMDK